MSQYGSDGFKAFIRTPFVRTHRVCRACGEVKRVEEFRPMGKYRRHHCLVCERLMAKTIRKANASNPTWIEKQRASQKRYRRRNLDKIKAYQREYQRKYKERHVDSKPVL